MENIKTIDQYIAAEMVGKVEKKKDSPIVGLLLLAIGVVLMILMKQVALPDSLQAATLTVGILALAVGIVLSAMSLTGAMWHYKYLSTGSRMKDKKVYLSVSDYQKAVGALTGGDREALSTLQRQTSSNSASARMAL